MVIDVVTAVLVAVSSVAIVVVLPRSLKSMREGDNDWRHRWRTLDRGRQLSIMRALKQGKPVAEQRDVELALRASAQLDHVLGSVKTFELAMLPVLAAICLFGFSRGSRFSVVVTFVILLVCVLTGGDAWRRARRRHRSVDATRQLHGL